MEQNTQVETRVQNEVGIIDIAGEVKIVSKRCGSRESVRKTCAPLTSFKSEGSFA